MIRSLEYLVQNFEERVAYNQRDLADSEKKCGELETKIGLPFEHEAKLQSLAQRQQQLEDALDITKNQAANSLSTEEAGQTTEPETESAEKTIRQTHGQSAAKKPAAKIRVAMAH
jgi:cell shape-determining protein MreC